MPNANTNRTADFEKFLPLQMQRAEQTLPTGLKKSERKGLQIFCNPLP